MKKRLGMVEQSATQIQLTRVQTYPQPKLLVGPMPDAELVHGGQQGQRHARDFPGVEIAVAHRQAGHNHVSVTDGFDLFVWIEKNNKLIYPSFTLSVY